MGFQPGYRDVDASAVRLVDTLSPSKYYLRSTRPHQTSGHGDPGCRLQRSGGNESLVLLGGPDGLGGDAGVPAGVGAQHVTFEVAGAGVGRGAQGALLGFFPSVFQRVVLQVGNDLERCAAVGTHVGAFTCNDTDL